MKIETGWCLTCEKYAPVVGTRLAALDRHVGVCERCARLVLEAFSPVVASSPELEQMRARDLARARAASIALGIEPVQTTCTSSLELVRLRVEQMGGRMDLELERAEWDRGRDALARQVTGLGGRGGDA